MFVCVCECGEMEIWAEDDFRVKEGWAKSHQNYFINLLLGCFAAAQKSLKLLFVCLWQKF